MTATAFLVNVFVMLVCWTVTLCGVALAIGVFLSRRRK